MGYFPSHSPLHKGHLVGQGLCIINPSSEVSLISSQQVAQTIGRTGKCTVSRIILSSIAGEIDEGNLRREVPFDATCIRIRWVYHTLVHIECSCEVGEVRTCGIEYSGERIWSLYLGIEDVFGGRQTIRYWGTRGAIGRDYVGTRGRDGDTGSSRDGGVID